jgi:hypothetical protein
MRIYDSLIALHETADNYATAKANIAAAITAKGGTVNAGDGISNFAADIATIPEGGGAVTESDVNFYAKGKLIAAYTTAQAQALSALPTPDEIEGFTFQEWDISLARINVMTAKVNVKAVYITANGKTQFDIILTTLTGLSPTLSFSKSDGSTLTVDWDDGTTNTYTATGNVDAGPHTYSVAGKYSIKTWISSGTGTYDIGHGNPVMGESTGYRQALIAVYIGSNITRINNSAFMNAGSLLEITIPRGITTIGSFAFSNNYAVRPFAIPSTVTELKDYALANTNAIETFIFPSALANIRYGALNGHSSCQSFYFQSLTPPPMQDATLNSMPAICIIHVPAASLSAYQAATNWATYAAYMVGDL